MNNLWVLILLFCCNGNNRNNGIFGGSCNINENCGCDNRREENCGCGNRREENCGCGSRREENCGCSNRREENCGCVERREDNCGCIERERENDCGFVRPRPEPRIGFPGCGCGD